MWSARPRTPRNLTPRTWSCGSLRIARGSTTGWHGRPSWSINTILISSTSTSLSASQPTSQTSSSLRRTTTRVPQRGSSGLFLHTRGRTCQPTPRPLDMERSAVATQRLLPWQTDTSISVHSWGYVEHDEYRTADSLIQQLVDTVSKNGNLLLNVGPKSDGTIADDARTVLLGHRRLAQGQWRGHLRLAAIHRLRRRRYENQGARRREREGHRHPDVQRS